MNITTVRCENRRDASILTVYVNPNTTPFSRNGEGSSGASPIAVNSFQEGSSDSNNLQGSDHADPLSVPVVELTFRHEGNHLEIAGQATDWKRVVMQRPTTSETSCNIDQQSTFAISCNVNRTTIASNTAADACLTNEDVDESEKISIDEESDHEAKGAEQLKQSAQSKSPCKRPTKSWSEVKADAEKFLSDLALYVAERYDELSQLLPPGSPLGPRPPSPTVAPRSLTSVLTRIKFRPRCRKNTDEKHPSATSDQKPTKNKLRTRWSSSALSLSSNAKTQRIFSSVAEKVNSNLPPGAICVLERQSQWATGKTGSSSLAGSLSPGTLFARLSRSRSLPAAISSSASPPNIDHLLEQAAHTRNRPVERESCATLHHVAPVDERGNTTTSLSPRNQNLLHHILSSNTPVGIFHPDNSNPFHYTVYSMHLDPQFHGVEPSVSISELNEEPILVQALDESSVVAPGEVESSVAAPEEIESPAVVPEQIESPEADSNLTGWQVVNSELSELSTAAPLRISNPSYPAVAECVKSLEPQTQHRIHHLYAVNRPVASDHVLPVTQSAEEELFDAAAAASAARFGQTEVKDPYNDLPTMAWPAVMDQVQTLTSSDHIENFGLGSVDSHAPIHAHDKNANESDGSETSEDSEDSEDDSDDDHNDGFKGGCEDGGRFDTLDIFLGYRRTDIENSDLRGRLQRYQERWTLYGLYAIEQWRPELALFKEQARKEFKKLFRRGRGKGPFRPRPRPEPRALTLRQRIEQFAMDCEAPDRVWKYSIEAIPL